MAVEAAKREFARAQAEHRRRESARQKKVVDARREHAHQVAQAEREVAEHNARIDKMAVGLREGDRHAVSEYIEIVLNRSPYPDGFPIERKAGYVPESSLLAVEWYLPQVDIVPEHKAFRHIKTRKSIDLCPEDNDQEERILPVQDHLAADGWCCNSPHASCGRLWQG